MSEMYQRLARSSWDGKYHVVFAPKRRRKVLFGQARRKWGEVFHALARQKECQIEGHRWRTMCQVYRDSSEVSGGLRERISEREERHSDGPLVWQRAEFHGLRSLYASLRIRTPLGIKPRISARHPISGATKAKMIRLHVK